MAACNKPGQSDLRNTDTSVPSSTGVPGGVPGGTPGGTTGGTTGGTPGGTPTGTGTGTGTGGTATSLLVDVQWSNYTPNSQVDITITDPLGNTDWNFGMAETEAGVGVGWFGEDCYLGTGSWNYCHPITGTTLHLDQVADIADIVEGQTTLFWTGMDLTYFLEDANTGDCWVWGHDTTYYYGLGCSVLGANNGRRGGCSGMDPADPAGLGGKVALTFDDGPDAVVTPQILTILRNYNIPATFFMLGTSASDPAVWPIIDDIDQDPLFEIANHSWDHADFTTLSTNDIHAEIDDTDLLLATWTPPSYFRFPYGNATCNAADIARNDYGQIVTGWHADTADWCYATGVVGTCDQGDYWRIPTGYESDMIGFTLDQLLAFDGGILLMHDIHQYTADNLDALISTLIANGFTFTSLDDATTFPLLNANTPYDFPWMGEGCDTNNDTCWQVEWNSWCEPTGDPAQPANAGICVLPCEDFCIDRDGVAPLHCAEALPGEGHCLAQSSSLNSYCNDVPGSVVANLPEWNAGSPWADVCVPYAW